MQRQGCLNSLALREPRVPLSAWNTARKKEFQLQRQAGSEGRSWREVCAEGGCKLYPDGVQEPGKNFKQGIDMNILVISKPWQQRLNSRGGEERKRQDLVWDLLQ